eukprot:s462_g43.t1
MLATFSGLLPCTVRINALRFAERGPKLVKPKHMIRTWKIRPGDLVYVNSGNDRGSTGEVLMIDPRRNMLKVKGMNKRKVADEEGNEKFIEKKMLCYHQLSLTVSVVHSWNVTCCGVGRIHYSNVALVDPTLARPTRVGLTFTEDGDAIRISKATGHVIPWPDPPKYLTVEEEHEEGPKDTPPEDAKRHAAIHASGVAWNGRLWCPNAWFYGGAARMTCSVCALRTILATVCALQPSGNIFFGHGTPGRPMARLARILLALLALVVLRFAPAFLPTTTGTVHNKVVPGAFAPPRAAHARQAQDGRGVVAVALLGLAAVVCKARPSATTSRKGFAVSVTPTESPALAGGSLSQDEAQSSRGLVARRSLYSCYTLYFRRWRYYEDRHAETEAEDRARRNLRNRAYNIFMKNRYKKAMKKVLRYCVELEHYDKQPESHQQVMDEIKGMLDEACEIIDEDRMFRAILRGSVKKGLIKRPDDPFTPAYKAIGYTLPECNLMREPRPWQLPNHVEPTDSATHVTVESDLHVQGNQLNMQNLQGMGLQNLNSLQGLPCGMTLFQWSLMS